MSLPELDNLVRIGQLKAEPRKELIGVRFQLIDFFLARLQREIVIVCYGC
jgi:hypothetical protein